MSKVVCCVWSKGQHINEHITLDKFSINYIGQEKQYFFLQQYKSSITQKRDGPM